MEGVYDWQKPLEIPRHDETEADKKPQAAMERAVERLRFPDSPSPGSVRLMEVVEHPDTDVPILAFLSQGASWGTYDVPLRVDVFPRDSIRQRRRAYMFRPDGCVIVETERNGHRERSDGPDMVELERVQGWPEAVRHMFLYVAQVLRDSVRWEIQLAESLEILAPCDGGGIESSARYEIGKRDGAAGLAPANSTPEYLKGYAEGRDMFILHNPAMR